MSGDPLLKKLGRYGAVIIDQPPAARSSVNIKPSSWIDASDNYFRHSMGTPKAGWERYTATGRVSTSPHTLQWSLTADGVGKVTCRCAHILYFRGGAPATIGAHLDPVNGHPCDRSSARVAQLPSRVECPCCQRRALPLNSVGGLVQHAPTPGSSSCPGSGMPVERVMYEFEGGLLEPLR